MKNLKIKQVLDIIKWTEEDAEKEIETLKKRIIRRFTESNSSFDIIQTAIHSQTDQKRIIELGNEIKVLREKKQLLLFVSKEEK